MFISDPQQTVLKIQQKQDELDKCVIMKILCPPGYHQIVATHVLGNIIFCCTLLVPMNQKKVKKSAQKESSNIL